MAALADVLNQRLRAYGVLAEAVECIVEIVQADADQDASYVGWWRTMGDGSRGTKDL